MEKVRFEDTVLGQQYEDERKSPKGLQIFLIVAFCLLFIVGLFVMLDNRSPIIREDTPLFEKLTQSEYWYTYENKEDTEYGYSEQYYEIRFAEDNTAELIKYMIYHVNGFDSSVGYELPDGTHLDESYSIIPIQTINFTYEVVDSEHFKVEVEGRRGLCECDEGEEYFTDYDYVIDEDCWLFSRSN